MNELVYLVGGIVMGIMIAPYVNQMIKNYVNRK
jgi:ABC-type phosphate transport system permease subunit